MLISKSVIDEIYGTIGTVEKESGGLIGSTDKSDIIDAYYFDKGRRSNANEYVPDIDDLQQRLSVWDKANITFRGIIHSHTIGDRLSPLDIQMARKIMDANMLPSILMPVYLIREKRIVCYEVSDDSELCIDFKTVAKGVIYEE